MFRTYEQDTCIKNHKNFRILDLRTGTPKKFANLLKRSESKNLRLCDLRTLNKSFLAHLCPILVSLFCQIPGSFFCRSHSKLSSPSAILQNINTVLMTMA
jgi:hypothetical protein